MAKTKATQQIVSPEVINMIRDIDRSLFDKSPVRLTESK